MKNTIYYFISVICGGVLMACELLTTRLIAPFFGGSIYVWASTIGFTMLGLAFGYFIAGKICKQNKNQKFILYNLLLLSTFVLVLPFYAQFIQNIFIQFSLKTGIVLTTFFINFPLYILFGLTSPLLISQLSENENKTAQVSGTIYGVSTISGVFFLLGTGLFTLLQFGATISVIICGVLLLLTTVMFYLLKFKINAQ